MSSEHCCRGLFLVSCSGKTMVGWHHGGFPIRPSDNAKVCKCTTAVSQVAGTPTGRWTSPRSEALDLAPGPALNEATECRDVTCTGEKKRMLDSAGVKMWRVDASCTWGCKKWFGNPPSVLCLLLCAMFINVLFCSQSFSRDAKERLSERILSPRCRIVAGGARRHAVLDGAKES